LSLPQHDAELLSLGALPECRRPPRRGSDAHRVPHLGDGPVSPGARGGRRSRRRRARGRRDRRAGPAGRPLPAVRPGTLFAGARARPPSLPPFAHAPPRLMPGLRRALGPLDATMINVGVMVGSVVFLTASDVARALPHPLLQLGAWVVAALFSLAGALTIAELGASMPEAGGLYVYLRRAFGPFWGFLYGWSLFAVIQTAAIAAVAVAFASYCGHF